MGKRPKGEKPGGEKTKRGKDQAPRRSMEEFEGRMGMLTTGEWSNPVSNMLHHV